MAISEQRARELADMEPPRSIERILRFLDELSLRMQTPPTEPVSASPWGAFPWVGANGMAAAHFAQMRIALNIQRSHADSARWIAMLMGRYQIGVAEVGDFTHWLVQWNDKRIETEVTVLNVHSEAEYRAATEASFLLVDRPQARGARAAALAVYTAPALSGEAGFVEELHEPRRDVRHHHLPAREYREERVLEENDRRRERPMHRRIALSDEGDTAGYRKVTQFDRRRQEPDVLSRAWEQGRKGSPEPPRLMGAGTQTEEAGARALQDFPSGPASRLQMFQRGVWATNLGLTGVDTGLILGNTATQSRLAVSGGIPPEAERVISDMPLSRPPIPTASYLGAAPDAPYTPVRVAVPRTPRPFEFSPAEPFSPPERVLSAPPAIPASGAGMAGGAPLADAAGAEATAATPGMQPLPRPTQGSVGGGWLPVSGPTAILQTLAVPGAEGLPRVLPFYDGNISRFYPSLRRLMSDEGDGRVFHQGRKSDLGFPGEAALSAGPTSWVGRPFSPFVGGSAAAFAPGLIGLASQQPMGVLPIGGGRNPLSAYSFSPPTVGEDAAVYAQGALLEMQGPPAPFALSDPGWIQAPARPYLPERHGPLGPNQVVQGHRVSGSYGLPERPGAPAPFSLTALMPMQRKPQVGGSAAFMPGGAYGESVQDGASGGGAEPAAGELLTLRPEMGPQQRLHRQEKVAFRNGNPLIPRPEMGLITLIAPPLQVASADAERKGIATHFNWQDLAGGAGPLDEGGLARLSAVLPPGAQALYPAVPAGSLGLSAVNLPLSAPLVSRLMSSSYGPQTASMASLATRQAALQQGGSSHAMPLTARIVPTQPPMGSQAEMVTDQGGNSAGALAEAGGGQARRGGALDFLGMPVRLAPSLGGRSDLAHEVAARTTLGTPAAGGLVRPEQFAPLRDRVFPAFQSVEAEPDRAAWRKAAPSFGLHDSRPTTILSPDARAHLPLPSEPLPQTAGGNLSLDRPLGLPRSLVTPMLSALSPHLTGPAGEASAAQLSRLVSPPAAEGHGLPGTQPGIGIFHPEIGPMPPTSLPDAVTTERKKSTARQTAAPTSLPGVMATPLAGIVPTAPMSPSGGVPAVPKFPRPVMGAPAIPTPGFGALSAPIALPAGSDAPASGFTPGMHVRRPLGMQEPSSPRSFTPSGAGSRPAFTGGEPARPAASRLPLTTLTGAAPSILSGGSVAPVSTTIPIRSSSLRQGRGHLPASRPLPAAHFALSGVPSIHAEAAGIPAARPKRSRLYPGGVPAGMAALRYPGDGQGEPPILPTGAKISSPLKAPSALQGLPGIGGLHAPPAIPGSSITRSVSSPVSLTMPAMASHSAPMLHSSSVLVERAPHMTLPMTGKPTPRGGEPLVIQRSTSSPSAPTAAKTAPSEAPKQAAKASFDKGASAHEVQMLANEVWSVLKRRLQTESYRMGR